ncbi:uncharacterized protein ARB_06964 [Trichophyton benhamiae CBS 112371]|uniref:Uncharacterized protein n=1 Tax=Arthroderma benhamiae (strain ATCC MYA-4681 / CBS 112371) TaxID=663331 RepID=D4ARV0_ARTBC|nr:uncharacterized protein ARB_06964 [Trichophyton benhamiae CBS 112371]EFE34014.1 hypothetical protein ARB_06964 [Trichophyton benhamiae CBS 112371]
MTVLPGSSGLPGAVAFFKEDNTWIQRQQKQQWTGGRRDRQRHQDGSARRLSYRSSSTTHGNIRREREDNKNATKDTQWDIKRYNGEIPRPLLFLRKRKVARETKYPRFTVRRGSRRFLRTKGFTIKEEDLETIETTEDGEDKKDEDEDGEDETKRRRGRGRDEVEEMRLKKSLLEWSAGIVRQPLVGPPRETWNRRKTLRKSMMEQQPNPAS